MPEAKRITQDDHCKCAKKIQKAADECAATERQHQQAATRATLKNTHVHVSRSLGKALGNKRTGGFMYPAVQRGTKCKEAACFAHLPATGTGASPEETDTAMLPWRH